MNNEQHRRLELNNRCVLTFSSFPGGGASLSSAKGGTRCCGVGGVSKQETVPLPSHHSDSVILWGETESVALSAFYLKKKEKEAEAV